MGTSSEPDHWFDNPHHWFNPEKAERFDENRFPTDDGALAGVHLKDPECGQVLYRTYDDGVWVLETWSHHPGAGSRVERVSGETAREWLVTNEDSDEIIARFFGEAKRKRGRPAIGGEVLVRLGDLLEQVDEYAAGFDTTRANAIRELISTGLKATYEH